MRISSKMLYYMTGRSIRHDHVMKMPFIEQFWKDDKLQLHDMWRI